MTRNQQRRIISIGIVVNLVLFVFICGVGVIYYLGMAQELSRFFFYAFPESKYSPSIIDSVYPGPSLSFQIIASLGQVFFGLSATLFLYLYFKKTTSAELFFFMFALLCLSFEGFRFVNWLILELWGTAYPLMIFTRLVYLGKIVGILSLFWGGVFANGLSAQKQGVLLGLGLLVSLIIVASIPLDITEVQYYFLIKVSEVHVFLGVLLSLQLLAIINYFMAVYYNSNIDYVFIALGVILFAIGRELLFFLPFSWCLPLGFICLGLGSYLFAAKTYSIYLWL